MSDLIATVTDAARNFLDTLDPTQRDIAQLPFDPDGERTNFFYTPTDHGGISLVDMTPAQHRAAFQLLAASVSAGHYNTAVTVMGLENVLARQEDFEDFPWFDHQTRARNPNRYFVAIFGNPDQGAWSWRFGGHHVSVSVTISEGEFRLHPSFLGANPANSAGVGANQLRPLAAEEDLARQLVRSLTPEQLALAVLSDVAPPDLVTGNRAHLVEGLTPPTAAEIWRESQPGEIAAAALTNGADLPTNPAAVYTTTPGGLTVDTFDAPQRETLGALLRQYTARMPNEVATAELARIGGIPPSALTFVWAGSTEVNQKHYYRVQGPNLLIEYDNTQNNANHIHTIWRDSERDFGRDLLAQHYAAAH
jgi:hypothetical protein